MRWNSTFKVLALPTERSTQVSPKTLRRFARPRCTASVGRESDMVGLQGTRRLWRSVERAQEFGAAGGRGVYGNLGVGGRGQGLRRDLCRCGPVPLLDPL